MALPETVCPIDGNELDNFLSEVDTDTVFEDMGVGHFLYLKNLVHSMIA